MGNSVTSTSVVEAMMGKRIVTPRVVAAPTKVREVEQVAASAETVEDAPAEEPEDEEEAETEAPLAPVKAMPDMEMGAEEEAEIAAAISAASTPLQDINVAAAKPQEPVEAATHVSAEKLVDSVADLATTEAAAAPEEALVTVADPEEEEVVDKAPTYTLLGTEGADDERLPVSVAFEEQDGFHVAFLQHADAEDNDTFTGIAVFPDEHIVVISATNAPMHDHLKLDINSYELDLIDEVERTIPTGAKQDAEKSKISKLVGSVKAAAQAVATKVVDAAKGKKSTQNVPKTSVFKKFHVPDAGSPFFKKVMRRFKSAMKMGYDAGNVSSAFHLVRIKTAEAAGKPVGSVPESLHYVAAVPNNTGGFLSGTFKVEQWNMGLMAPFTHQATPGKIHIEVGGVVFYLPASLKDTDIECLGHFFANDKGEGEVKNVKVSGTASDGKNISTTRSYRILGPEFSVKKLPGKAGHELYLHPVGTAYSSKEQQPMTWAWMDAWERQKVMSNYWRDELAKAYIEVLKSDTSKPAAAELKRFKGVILDREIKEEAQRLQYDRSKEAGRPLPSFPRIDVEYIHTKSFKLAFSKLDYLKRQQRNEQLDAYGIDYDAFLALNTIFNAMTGERKVWNLILPYTPVSSGVYLKATTYKPELYRWTELPPNLTAYDVESRKSYALRWIKAYSTTEDKETKVLSYGESGQRAVVGNDLSVTYTETPDRIAGVVDPLMVHISGTSYRQDLQTQIRDAVEHLHTLPKNTDFEGYLMALIAENKKKGRADPVGLAKDKLKATLDVVMGGNVADASNRYEEVVSWYDERSNGQKGYLNAMAAEKIKDGAEVQGENYAENEELYEGATDAMRIEAARLQRESAAERLQGFDQDLSIEEVAKRAQNQGAI
jgi:hypothetical protein